MYHNYPNIYHSKEGEKSIDSFYRGLTGSPIGGALITVDHGGFTGLIAFSASILTVGGALVLLARFMAAPKIRIF